MAIENFSSAKPTPDTQQKPESQILFTEQQFKELQQGWGESQVKILLQEGKTQSEVVKMIIEDVFSRADKAYLSTLRGMGHNEVEIALMLLIPHTPRGYDRRPSVPRQFKD